VIVLLPVELIVLPPPVIRFVLPAAPIVFEDPATVPKVFVVAPAMLALPPLCVSVPVIVVFKSDVVPDV
jgi:hypothetical protein